MTPRLAAHGLTYRYKTGGGLVDVSLPIGAGERVALLGPNGAGKTTLLLHLAGLVRPDSGTVRVDGHRMQHQTNDLARWRAAVGLLFQDPNDQLFGPSVIEDVAIGPRNRGLTPAAARTQAYDVLRWLRIEELADEPIHALSYGRRRVVALAGVLAQAPGVLLLDEPTLGLDAAAEDDLLLTLERLRGDGVGMLMATHDVDLACRWADTIAVMQHGRLTGIGQPDDVLTDEHLRAARLRHPWALAAGRELRRAGILPGDEPIPRSGIELVDRLRARLGARPTIATLVEAS